MNAQVSKLLPSLSDPSSVGTVIVKSASGQEESLAADVVIMGVGVAPATEYLKASKGFENLVDKSGAITVDEFLRVKGLDGSVYAIGKFDSLSLDVSCANRVISQVISRCTLNLAPEN